MDFIFDNLKFIIAAVVGLLWIIGKAAEKKKSEQEDHEPWTPDEDYERWEPEPAAERQPPPMPSRAGNPPPLPMFVEPSHDELERQRIMHERLNALKKERKPAAETSRKKKAAAAPVSPSLQARLRNRRELRRAIVMREILDPPVGLR